MKKLLYHAAFSLLALSAVLAAPARAQPPQSPARPNILLVLSDDHSAAFLGCYGDKIIKTPNFDRFAGEGARFDRAYVASPQCVPSRAAFMTGRSPVATGMTRFSAPLPADVVSFPELLRAGAGYHTGILGRSYHLDGSRLPEETRIVFDKYGLRTFAKRVDYLPDGAQGRARVPALMNAFFDQAPKNKPWFLQVGFSDPHRTLDKNAIPDPHDPDKLVLPPFFPETPALREDLARYYDEVSRLDGDFGRVLKVLEERGQARNTLVVFMGDNGGALLRGKGTLYELGVRVPLLARWPQTLKPGTTTSALISGEDLAPTFLEAAGVAVPKQMTGKSFLPLLRGTTAGERQYVFSERGAHGSGLPSGTGAFDLGRCVVGKTHKLVYNALWQLPYSPVDFSGNAFWKEIQAMHKEGKLAPQHARLYFPPARPMFELFDLSRDPHEMENLAGKPEHAAVERELKAVLQEWMILNRDYLPLPVPPGRGTPRQQSPQGEA
jgi:arylsulfatase A-like enzyme